MDDLLKKLIEIKAEMESSGINGKPIRRQNVWDKHKPRQFELRMKRTRDADPKMHTLVMSQFQISLSDMVEAIRPIVSILAGASEDLSDLVTDMLIGNIKGNIDVNREDLIETMQKLQQRMDDEHHNTQLETEDLDQDQLN